MPAPGVLWDGNAAQRSASGVRRIVGSYPSPLAFGYVGKMLVYPLISLFVEAWRDCDMHLVLQDVEPHHDEAKRIEEDADADVDPQPLPRLRINPMAVMLVEIGDAIRDFRRQTL